MFVCGRCQSNPTLFLAHSLDTSMQFFKSPGEDSFANIAIISSAGKRQIGDTRHLSSISRLPILSVKSEDTEGASDDCESFAWSMKESLSSSTPRSGDVEADESEFEPLRDR